MRPVTAPCYVGFMGSGAECRSRIGWVSSAFVFALACSSEPQPGNGGSGGAPAQGGATSGGATSGGATSGGTTSSGGATSGGAMSSGGVVSSGGAPTSGGAPSAGANSGGSTSAGMGGANGGAGGASAGTTSTGGSAGAAGASAGTGGTAGGTAGSSGAGGASAGKGGASAGTGGSAGGSGGATGFTLTTPAWTAQAGCAPDNKAACPIFPKDNTNLEGGKNQSPELNWTAGPAGTQSYAIVLHDLSNIQQGNPFVHWVMWNIPGATRQLPANLEKTAMPSVPAGSSQRAYQGNGYIGSGKCGNVYEFVLFALTTATFTPTGAATQTAAATALKATNAPTATLRARSGAPNCTE